VEGVELNLEKERRSRDKATEGLREEIEMLAICFHRRSIFSKLGASLAMTKGKIDNEGEAKSEVGALSASTRT
jgi:hypothetical protein